jgi:hypothetical protein
MQFKAALSDAFEPGNAAQESAFAASAGSEDTEEFTVSDAQINPRQRKKISRAGEPLGDSFRNDCGLGRDIVPRTSHSYFSPLYLR